LVEEKTALHLRAKRDFIDRYNFIDGKCYPTERKAGDEWLYKGPSTYLPQVEADVLNTIRAIILNHKQALRLRAKDKCIDYIGNERFAGQEWNVKLVGAYLPEVKEEVVALLDGIVLTYNRSIHVRALRTYHDQRKDIERKAGSQWLITKEDCEIFIPEVTEEIIDPNVPLVVVNARRYCVIEDPMRDGVNQLGQKVVCKGPLVFYLSPGEKLVGTYDVTILGSDEYISIQANESFIDGNYNKKRKPGDKWIVYGPNEFYTEKDVTILQRGKAFLLVEPLGLYVFSPTLFILSVLFVIFVYVYGGIYNIFS